MTGIDRVELAYLDHLLDLKDPLFALVKTSVGFGLVDRTGAAAIRDRLTGVVEWGQKDFLSPVRRGLPASVRRAEADVARLAIGRSTRWQLGRMLRRKLPSGTAYLNTGHSNLTASNLRAWKSLPDATIAVLIHDTIPLDLPDLQRPGTVRAFHKKVAAVSKYADLVIHNSEVTQADCERHMAACGRVPVGVVAHLGVTVPTPIINEIPAELPFDRPYFVTLGTIEPRKNHALLLDIWDGFNRNHGLSSPRLFIIGRRGWLNRDVFHWLDTSPLMDNLVYERTELSDNAVSALISGSNGLLMPSLAEGFGLPVAEALALGVPVLCNDLPVYREFAGDIPVYANVSDMYLWATTITRMAEKEASNILLSNCFSARQARMPSWKDHFNLVLSLT